MTKHRDPNEDILFADIQFRTTSSKVSGKNQSNLYDNPPTTKKRKSRFRWLTLIIVAGILFGGTLTMAWYSYMRGYDTASDEFAPHIAADDTPIKLKPDEPGGMKIPHQNRHVYDMLSSGENKARKVEHLLPPPELPILAQNSEKDIPAAEEDPDTAFESNLDEKTVEIITPKEPSLNSEISLEPKTEPEPETETKSDSFESRLALLIPETKTESPKVEAPKIVEAPIQTEPKPKNLQMPVPAALTSSKVTLNESEPKSISNSKSPRDTRLQLGAVRSSQEAQKEINRLKRTYPEVFKNCELIAKNVDLGPKGIFYRIQTTNMPKADADRVLEMLKKAKQACFVVKP